MNLEELRQQFVKLSGRFDLIDPGTGADAGANFFINAGQRALERLAFISYKRQSIQEIELAAGAHEVALTRPARGVEMLSVVYSDGEVILPFKSFRSLKVFFGKPFAQLENGSPLFWTVDIGAEAALVTKLLVLPAPDQALLVNVYGQFYSADFTLDTDTTFWSLVAPELLLKAALWQLEVFYRNTEGSRDWLNAIELELSSLDMDGVFSETNHITQMRG